ncbi:MAG: YhfC family glutamic-type intramembrane protease [Anaerolineales bacterium]|jgi:uncharacterized membrane protein YhfC
MVLMLYFTYPLAGLLIVALAFGLGVVITRKFGLSWRLYGVGAAVFICSQIFHIPFNYWLLQPFIRAEILPTLSKTQSLLISACLLGLSAGLFEETARYLAYRWWAKDARSWARGLLLGAGHGGVEAILVGMLVLLTFVQMVALRGRDLSSLVPPDLVQLAEQQVNAYWSASWYDSLLALIERAFTLPVQIALSILVLQVFVRNQSRWLWTAIGWHTLVDGVAVFSSQNWSVYFTEALIGLLCVLSIAIIYALRGADAEPAKAEQSVPVKQPIPALRLPQIEETLENLDSTRYN